jgi:hypothetical protein
VLGHSGSGYGGFVTPFKRTAVKSLGIAKTEVVKTTKRLMTRMARNLFLLMMVGW